MAKSFNNLRVGKRFSLTNYGEVSEFEVMDIMTSGDCSLRDIHTLESYTLFDLVRYGKGDDFDIDEL